jgi:hypothetical protein
LAVAQAFLPFLVKKVIHNDMVDLSNLHHPWCLYQILRLSFPCSSGANSGERTSLIGTKMRFETDLELSHGDHGYRLTFHAGSGRVGG